MIRRMPKVIRDNGLSIVVLLLFALSLAGQSIAGHHQYNEEQHEHGKSPITYVQYIATAAFMESVFENWESEFLQMALYVWLTSFLYQRGSAESKDQMSRTRSMRTRRRMLPILKLRLRSAPVGYS